MEKSKISNENCKTYLGCIKKRAPVEKQPDRTINMGVPDHDVPNNAVETTKYNLMTFFPKNFMQQISKSANLYFFIMGIWQMIPEITTTQGHPLVYMPLTIIITISMIKDFLEDWRRRKEDNRENNTLVNVLRKGKFEKTKSKDIRIGDVVMIHENHFFQADILLLKVPDNKNLAYIETKNLDGETNLKPIQVHTQLQNYWKKDEEFENHKIQFHYEKPSLAMYKFNGYFSKLNENDEQAQQKHYNFDVNNFIYRGSLLRNVDWVIGVVLYTGHDTKIMLNSISGKYKTSKIEKQMNIYIIYIFSLLLAFSVFSAIYSTIWQDYNEDGLNMYSNIEKDAWNVFLIRIPQWLLLLSNFVPISLLVTIELVKFGQALLTSLDHNYKYRGMKAVVNSSNLNEQLGIVNYIFSDKTGTLTSNLMRFKSLLAGDVSYGHSQELSNLSSSSEGDIRQMEDDEGIIGLEINQNELVDFQDDSFNNHFGDENHSNYKNILECLTCINLCHTVHVEIKNDTLKFLASSPDECALVNFAQEHNFQYQGKYQLLNTLEFSYERKRMSVIVKNLQTQEIIIYCKGADQIIHSLMCPTQGKQQQKQDEILKQYSVKGLRTLCLARKVISQQEYNEWNEKYQKSLKSLSQDRLVEINRLQNEIENNLQLIGATAIEDKLQDDIAETIESFKQAGIQTWMLTGDKIETAINIGRNCSLIEKSSEIVVLNNPKKFDLNFQKAKEITESFKGKKGKSNLVLVISGQAFEHIKQLKKLPEFTEILLKCECVLGCRVTPKEKQEFVCLIKEAEKSAITLAIGDGANDVSMITESHVGIGIQGLEGREAAKASDFAIGQFKHLRRLLFYTGQESYRKNSGMIFYNFYKNQSWILTCFFFGFYSGFSGQYLYDQIMQQFFNLLFASLPIILYAFFDEVYASSEVLELPQKKPNKLEFLPIDYLLNRENQLFSGKNFWLQFMKGAAHSLILVLIGIYIYCPSSPFQEGHEADLYMVGMYVFSLAVILNNIKVVLMHKTHYGFTLFFCLASIVLYFAFFYMVSTRKEVESAYQFNRIISSVNSYLGILLMIGLTSLTDMAIDRYWQMFIVSKQYQEYYHKILEKKEHYSNQHSTENLCLQQSDASPSKLKNSSLFQENMKQIVPLPQESDKHNLKQENQQQQEIQLVIHNHTQENEKSNCSSNNLFGNQKEESNTNIELNELQHNELPIQNKYLKENEQHYKNPCSLSSQSYNQGLQNSGKKSADFLSSNISGSENGGNTQILSSNFKETGRALQQDEGEGVKQLNLSNNYE